MKAGGESDPRNKALMKMFNLIEIGERAGSGVPELFSVWEDPIIEENFNPDRTVLKVSFIKKVPEKSDRKKITKKTLVQYSIILSHMERDKWYKSTDFLEVLNVKERRTNNL